MVFLKQGNEVYTLNERCQGIQISDQKPVLLQTLQGSINSFCVSNMTFVTVAA